jgi:hypothetical protein
MSLTELTAGENKFFESGGQEAPPEATEVSAPEPVTNTPAPTAPVQQDDKQVPLAALHEARQIQKELREQAKKAQDEARFAREKAEKMEQTFQSFLAERTKEAAPKYEEDPLGALKYENDQLKKQVEEVNTGVKKTQDEWQRTQQYQSFAQHVQSQEASYKQQAQDYDQAIAYLKDVRLQDYADLGYTQEDATAALQNEILGLAQAAVQKGKNAADVAYKMAQRYGYKAKTSDSKLETLAKGQEASKSLAGGKADVALTLDALSQLDDEQLNALIKDDAAWRKLGR